MKVRQHIPGFVTGVEPEECDVNSMQELMELPWVDHWEVDINPRTKFYRWSVDRSSRDRSLLMAEYSRNDRQWWVVAYLPALADLPDWLDLPSWSR